MDNYYYTESIPKPSLNGGLYTGEKFAGPWGNVPAIPDATYMTNVNILSANPQPPFEATFQYPGNTRPGNNIQALKGIENGCIVSSQSNNVPSGRFSGYFANFSDLGPN